MIAGVLILGLYNMGRKARQMDRVEKDILKKKSK